MKRGRLSNLFSQSCLMFFIFNPLCRRTIRQYVEQVLRLCTVLVFPPPFEFSFVHIYTMNSYPHTLSMQILLYTVKILQFVRLLLKVNYMNRSKIGPWRTCISYHFPVFHICFSQPCRHLKSSLKLWIRIYLTTLDIKICISLLILKSYHLIS